MEYVVIGAVAYWPTAVLFWMGFVRLMRRAGREEW
jgi:hypothetical protein